VELYTRGGHTWLRCQLHAHTTNSDGEASPAELCELYAAAGYDVLAITDHWHVTDWSHDSLVVIPSSELSALVEGGVGEAEVLALGASVLPDVRDYFPVLEAAAGWVAAQGGVPYLCHPYWSALEPVHYLEAPSLVGLEIYNAGGEILQGNGLSTVHWDDVLHRGARAFGIATDDCHYPGRDSGFAWTTVNAAERSREAVLKALRRGDFYASTGPELFGIDVTQEGVEVRCSEAASVTLRSGPWDGCRVNADPRALDWRGQVLARGTRDGITAARFEFTEYWPWARVEVQAGDGTRAWSNPFELPATGRVPGRGSY
jgi:hypothetical protein